MKQVNMSKIINYLTILGLLILLSAFFPSSWGNVATMLILPLLGALILILSIYYKKLWTGLISIFLIISFPLIFGIGYFIFGP
ncbi:TPA: hypothetical protein ACHVGB_001747 [Streptococcus suis]|uniref:hypothetical protein n=1 Tax=Streptococcus suis TaxID=1307 RepID=UPI0011467D4B|nr:hypothetical protein [Streptococcus suis]MBS0703881.1 hypothetical protein [Streptococcus suis]MCK3895966.1 hypothetical protein [Streptococcus suis]MDW8586877.1 hypothetical protein [Streptococcus suis]MDW8598842.1 hypothetical protein [Streptococcus suis]MDW8602963.1 hypothetical protein [Streptococcus suis]